MYTDHILEEKWKVQKHLSQNADYDINKFMDNVHSAVIRLKDQFHLTLKYSDREGGYSSTEKQ